VAVVVGQSEDAPPTVRSACLNRCEESRLNSVTQSFQVFDDLSEAESEVPLDILDEHEGRLAFTHDPHDVGPEMARVFSATAPAGVAEGLARVARSEEIHDSTPRCAVEGS
jgi:hypothetical protein